MTRWEYLRMWHPREWQTAAAPQQHGWKEWSIIPSGSQGPPIDAEDIDALNFMGDLGWELAHVEIIWDYPPGVYRQIDGGAPAYLFLLKRQRLDP